MKLSQSRAALAAVLFGGFGLAGCYPTYVAPMVVPGAPGNANAYKEFSEIVKVIGSVGTSLADTSNGPYGQVAAHNRKFVTVQLDGPINGSATLKFRYEDLSGPRAVNYGNAVDVEARIAVTGGYVHFNFMSNQADDTRKHFFTDSAQAYATALRFVDDLNILAQDPSSRMNVTYQAKYPAALAAFKAAGGKMDLPEEGRKYFVQAEGSVNDKNFEKAIDLFNKGLDVAPWFPRAHYNLSILLAEQENDYPGAMDEMKKYLELVPTAPDARDAQDKIYQWEAK